MDMKPLVIGTRGSDLALWQAKAVRDALGHYTSQAVEIKVIETRGDQHLELSLSNHKLDKGLFTRELEEELRTGEVDFAVHSLKDMPVEQPDGLTLAGVLPRADVHDVVVARPGLELHSVRDLVGLKVGTSSPRRISQLSYLIGADKAVTADIRGNVPTRIRKVIDGEYDAVLLAYAGLERLGLTDKVSLHLPLEAMLPAPGQGAIGIQCATSNTQALQLAKKINDPETMLTTRIERQVLAALGGGCALPLGILCRVDGREVCHIHVAYAPRLGADMIRHHYLVPVEHEPDALVSICRELSAGR